MLSAVGIIAEYNPFHNGHLYQLQMAKRLAHADVTVAVMSGNWVQRGAPSIVDKWQRTEMALAGGVDLVVELPVFGAVQPADIFAYEAIRIVDQLKCDALAFGCEHSNYDFKRLGQLEVKGDQQHFKDYQQSYPALLQAAVKSQLGVAIDQPNDILAFNYARAVHKLASPIKLVPIERIGSQHHDQNWQTKFASATAIRRALLAKNDDAGVSEVLPASSRKILLSSTPQLLDWLLFWPQLRYQLLTTSLADLRSVYQMTEGIESRLKQAAIQNARFTDFIDAVKTKRYTYPRIQRLLVATLLKLDAHQMLGQSPYIRVLGFSPLGQQYLNQVKKQIEWPIISKISQSVLQSQLAVEFKAGMLIQMQTNQFEDLYRHPIIKK